MKKYYKIFFINAVSFFLLLHHSNACTLRDSISSFTSVFCYGYSNGSATVGVKGGTKPYTYSWAPYGGTKSTATGLTSQMYTVTVTDSVGCIATATVYIGQPPRLQDSISYTSPSCFTCCDGKASGYFGGGTPPYCCFTWSNGQNGFYDTALCAGKYSFCFTDANGCHTCDTVNIPHGPTGIQQVYISQVVCSLYPNPSNGVFTIAMGGVGGAVQIEIFDMLGQKIYQNTIEPTNTNINLIGLNAGTYLYRIMNQSGNSISSGKFSIIFQQAPANGICSYIKP